MSAKVVDLLRGLPPDKRAELIGGHPLDEAEITTSFKHTDMGNAERMVYYYGDCLKYCHPWDKWLVWDEKRLKLDDTAAAARMARDTVKKMYEEASKIEDDDKRLAMATHARRSDSSGKIKAMLELAAIMEGVPVLPDQLDADPFLFNCLNGTLNLKTLELRPHRQTDLLTKLAPVAFDMNAKAPTWHEFLHTIMDGNRDLMTFLQKAVGYSLTGDTREQVLFILYGSGENGKSTFMETIAALLGDGYSLQMPMSTLMIRRNENIPNDLARLKGARFVSSVEAEEGQRLAESLVKQMTGGDRLVARFLRAEFFEFKPEFKLWLATNHKPQIRGTDHAIWRRIRLIPFEVKIPKEKQDKSLSKKLLAELPGVLAWALEGMALWIAEGLDPPAEVEKATADYRAEMDILSDFIDSCCIVNKIAKISAKNIYKAYLKWCEENGEKPLSQRTFGMRLTERGFAKFQGTGGYYFWDGIGLVDQVE